MSTLITWVDFKRPLLVSSSVMLPNPKHDTLPSIGHERARAPALAWLATGFSVRTLPTPTDVMWHRVRRGQERKE